MDASDMDRCDCFIGSVDDAKQDGQRFTDNAHSMDAVPGKVTP